MPFRKQYDAFIHGLSADEPVVESEWRPELDATEGLGDDEREAAARALRRMAKPNRFVGVDVARGGGTGFTLVGIRQAIIAMSQHSVAPAMRKFARSAHNFGRIMGQRSDLIVMDDLTSYRPRPTADRLAAMHGWYHAVIHPESLKHLVPDDPVFPPKVEGETVTPGLGRTCIAPLEAHVGEPIWPLGHDAPLPPDQMPASRTLQGHPRIAAQPSPRRTLAQPARGRHRKQRR